MVGFYRYAAVFSVTYFVLVYVLWGKLLDQKMYSPTDWGIHAIFSILAGVLVSGGFFFLRKRKEKF
jgi:LPXTG-motif cell wall-anchored protein